ncbi:hypothetical protein RFI_26179 [Reticulomyxa filosa]|uniref:PH domain-containing protein n=1 Tax=Reticulomyxa filosa TaxID=46433 RepID=X6MB03_RETFI|nr:hypothetical protein RFI_26179 [Reticulomyxa filosa]|eukprot:ETO11193.1 hypothetical protein RFI_26179 [Reticulomyxa filosa]
MQIQLKNCQYKKKDCLIKKQCRNWTGFAGKKFSLNQITFFLSINAASKMYIEENKENVQCDDPHTMLWIRPEWTVEDVLRAVAKKRNVNHQNYQLVITDTSNSSKENVAKGGEIILNPSASPTYYQNKVATSGQVSRYRFVFRKASNEADTNKTRLDEQTFFGDRVESIYNNNIDLSFLLLLFFVCLFFIPMKPKEEDNEEEYPSGYLETKQKIYQRWQRRYFVLIDDKLLCYKVAYKKKKKCREDYKSNSKDVQCILLQNPSAIVKVLWEKSPSPRKHSQTSLSETKEWWYFDIFTPTKVYALRTDDYDTLDKWVNALKREDETTKIVEDLDCLIAINEKRHADEDEKRMETHCELEDILLDRDLSEENNTDKILYKKRFVVFVCLIGLIYLDTHGQKNVDKSIWTLDFSLSIYLFNRCSLAHLKYLVMLVILFALFLFVCWPMKHYAHQLRHCDEFWYFWHDWYNFHTTWKDRIPERRKQLAEELYRKYIKKGTNLELSEIRKEQVTEIARLLENDTISQDMFNDIENTVRSYFRRTLYDFLQSFEYFHHLIHWNQWDRENRFEWPSDIEIQALQMQLSHSTSSVLECDKSN